MTTIRRVCVALSMVALVVCGCASCSAGGRFTAARVLDGTPTMTGMDAAGSGMTCGDGQIQSGESCEGTNLNGSNCSSLGFDSGTLACSASCKFDTSGCSGAINLMVTATRTTCAAPCAVFFDATSTVGLQGGDYVAASFNWDFDSTGVDPNGVHRATIGFVTAHVFDEPGTYQVAVRVRDLAGHAGSTTLPITVSALTGQTIYVSSKGNDSNAGTIAQPMATFSAAVAKARPQMSILFRRGDTFNLGASTVGPPQNSGPLLISSYSDPSSPSSVAPILSSTTSGSILNLGGSDFRMTDIHIKSTGAFQTAFINQMNHTLFERMDIEGIGSASPAGGCIVFQLGNTSDGTFIVDSHIHDFIGYGVYADRPTHFAVIGSTIEKFSGGDHGIRVQGGNDMTAGFATDSYVAESTITPNTDTSASFDTTAFRGDDTNIVEVNNTLARTASFTPQNDLRLEHISNVLVEGNVITVPDNYTAFSVIAQHVVIRNNLIINAEYAVEIKGQQTLPANWSDQIFVYNNTAYTVQATPTSFANALVFQSTTTGNVTIRNNILVQNSKNSASGVLFRMGSMGTETSDHNLLYSTGAKPTASDVGAGGLETDPQFVTTTPGAPNAFYLSPGSPAVDSGAMLPVYQDLAGVARPIGAGWDMGAFELRSATGSQDASTGAVATTALVLPGQASKQ